MILSIEKVEKTYYHKLIQDTIKTIINQFYRKPFNFFNEHDFHQYCYHAFYRRKEFSRQYATKDKDGKRTNILHPEYPTLKRFKRRPTSLDPKGVRARYDMAILNPKFIENNSFEKVRCRDIKLFKDPKDFKSKNLIAAFEFKYIIKHSPNFIHEIEFDYIKLKNADEVGLKYMLVFANTVKREKEEGSNYFKSLVGGKGIKIIYVVVYYDKGKKIIRIKQYPRKWLKN